MRHFAILKIGKNSILDGQFCYPMSGFYGLVGLKMAQSNLSMRIVMMFLVLLIDFFL